jgi:hypothetical protein
MSQTYTFRFDNTPRLCKIEGCKRKYKPTSAGQKYCPRCKKLVDGHKIKRRTG